MLRLACDPHSEPKTSLNLFKEAAILCQNSFGQAIGGILAGDMLYNGTRVERDIREALNLWELVSWRRSGQNLWLEVQKLLRSYRSIFYTHEEEVAAPDSSSVPQLTTMPTPAAAFSPAPIPVAITASPATSEIIVDDESVTEVQ